MLTLCLVAVSSVLSVSGPFDPPPGQVCLGQPLELNLSDLLRSGQVADELVRNRCVEADLRAPFGRHALKLGKVDIGTFWLGGEKITYGFDWVLSSEEAMFGDLPARWPRRSRLDQIHFVPTLRLPSEWQRIIDKATYPALIAGTAAIGTLLVLDFMGAR